MPQHFAVAIVLYALETPGDAWVDQPRTPEWSGFRKSVDLWIGERYVRELRWLASRSDVAKVSAFIAFLLDQWDDKLVAGGVEPLRALLRERAP